MKDTATGRRLLRDGRAEGQRRSILLLLQARLGTVPAWVAARLDEEQDQARLERLLVAALDASPATDLEALFAPHGSSGA